jgi:hypothetical protein
MGQQAVNSASISRSKGDPSFSYLSPCKLTKAPYLAIRQSDERRLYTERGGHGHNGARQVEKRPEHQHLAQGDVNREAGKHLRK